MTNVSKAWVWATYQGIVEGNSADPSHSESLDGDRVVPLRAAESRSATMRQNATSARTKCGFVILASILIAVFFPLISLVLFLIGVILVVSGKEPQKVEGFLAGVPGGDYVIKALARVDRWLS